MSWWLSGLSYDAMHGVGNFAIMLVLYRPLRKALRAAKRQIGWQLFAFPPWGKVAPQGQIRGACATVTREEAIAVSHPSSVRAADSFPKGEAFFICRQWTYPRFYAILYQL